MTKLLFTMLSFILSMHLMAQKKTITGVVMDDKGNPIIGVIITAGKNKSVSIADGSYTIDVPSYIKRVSFSATNYETGFFNVGTTPSLNVALKNIKETEVVVTGYAIKKKLEFTGATTKVTAKQIEQVPIASFEQILQGRAPGLYIASGSGQPGTAARVNIRGVGSISGGNDPLYVLDGIPIESAVFRTLNPNDFESVDILKDASGAGLYGSRGANGVIVITSKKGKVGKVKFQYRGQTGISQAPPPLNLHMMNTAQRLEYEEKILGPSGILPASGAITGYPGWDYSVNNPRYQTLTSNQRLQEANLLDSIRSINTNWADVFFRNARFVQHELNASGGSDGLNFYTSLSSYKQEGVVIRSNLERYTFKGNIDFKTEKVTISIRSLAGFSTQSGIESEAGVSLANPIAAAYFELPYRKLRTDAGSVDVGSGKTAANAFDRLNTTTSSTNQFKANLGVTLQYNIFKGLSFKTTNGVDWRNDNFSRFIDPNSFAGASAPGTQGSYRESNTENLQLISTTGLQYNKIINQKHAINAMAMYEGIRNRFRTFGATGYGINTHLLNTPAGITPGSATNNFIPLIGGARTLNGLSSTFILGDYTYNKTYTLSASLRNDVPSQVPKKNRQNVFYTFGFGYNLMPEKYMQKQHVFQDARIRLSIGQAANVNGFNSNFGYIPTYGNAASGYAGVPGIIPTSLGNENYKLESQVIKNIGAEFSIWDRRAKISFDYYVKDSKNLFVDQNLSRTTGFAALSTNAAKMRNQGYEFKVDLDVVNKKNVIVTVSVNGAVNKNKVISLGDLSEIPQGTGIIREGYSLGTHYVVGYLGVDPQSGLPVYQDINGNPTNIYSASNNRAEYGTFLPKFTGGASVDASWKRISVSAFFSTAQGVKRFNNESFFYETTNANLSFNKRAELLQTWQKPGDITDYQKLSAPRQFSSKDVRDASFIRLRNVQVAYTFDFKASKPLKGFKVWAQGQNLYTWTKWTGFDPETSNNIATYQFPNPKTYTIGLDIIF